MYDFLLARPVPQPCDANLKLDLLRGVCVRPPCGRQGQPACTVLVRIPSCDLDLTERDGHCVRPACGRLGERACNVPTERMVIAASAGLCDLNLVMDLSGVCNRPRGLGSANAPTPTPTLTLTPVTPVTPVTPGSTPPPAAGTGGTGTPSAGGGKAPAVPGGFTLPAPPPPAANPGTGAPPPPPLLSNAVPPAPPGGFTLPRAPKVSAPPPAVVNPDAADLSATWRLNGNGYAGEIMLRQAADGRLSGTIYGEPLSGFYAAGERTVVLLRGAATSPIQAFIGQVGADGRSMSGRFFALNTHSAGGGSARNVFAFAAQREGPVPASPGALPSGTTGPASIGGQMQFNGNGHVGALQIAQFGDGTLTGSVYGTDRVEGHYAAGTGSVAFIRYSGNRAYQLFVGQALGGSLRGDFYALWPDAGATPQRMRYDWFTASAGVAQAPKPPGIR